MKGRGRVLRSFFFVTEDQEDQVTLIAFVEEQQQIPKHLNGKEPQHECGSIMFMITHDCFFPQSLTEPCLLVLLFLDIYLSCHSAC